jgi:hypothetical protein
MPTIKMTPEALQAAKSLAVRYSGVNVATRRLCNDPDDTDALLDTSMWCDLLADQMEAMGVSDWAEWTPERYRSYAKSCLERREAALKRKADRLAEAVRKLDATAY